ncbi:hypothetical protein Tco_0616455 [Tanacetum coccineum]
MEASKRRRSMLDYRIQQLSKGSSEGSGIIPEVPDEPKDNSGQHQHPHHQPHMLKFKCVRPLAQKTDSEKLKSVGWWKENREGQTNAAEDNMLLASPLYVQKAFDYRCTYARGEFSKDENIKNQRNLPRDIPLDRIEVLRYHLATQGLSKDSCLISHRDYTHFYQLSHSELVVTMEILPEPTSNKLCVTNRFTLIVLSSLRRSGKENKQVRYEHAGPKVTSSQVGKRSQDDDKRFDLADDLKEAQDQSLGHNLFNVGQFYDGDLEVTFSFKTCYVRNLEGDDLLTGARESNLYIISILDMAASSPVCLMAKATSTKS